MKCHQCDVSILSFSTPVMMRPETLKRGRVAKRRSPMCDMESHKGELTRLRARVAYDGTHYHGWQIQPNGRTVQGEIESVLERRFGRLIRVVGASRTDTGVHARGQGVHLDVPLERSSAHDHVFKLQFSLNQMLPYDIRVRNLSVAPLNGNERWWHSMYESRGKHYSYRFSTRAIYDPLHNLHRTHVHRSPWSDFNEQRVRDALNSFIGTHDFTAFANSIAPTTSGVGANPIRTLRKAELHMEAEGHFRIDFEVDGALYKMLRNVAGTVLEVGAGGMHVDDIPRFFASRDRSLIPKSAPAKGLCLEQVLYDNWDA